MQHIPFVEALSLCADFSSDLVKRQQQESVSVNESASSGNLPLPKSGWWRQYIFVAATLPDDNEKSPGAKIKGVSRVPDRLFPPP